MFTREELEKMNNEELISHTLRLQRIHEQEKTIRLFVQGEWEKAIGDKALRNFHEQKGAE